MSENNRTSEVLGETWHLLNTLQHDELYKHICSSFPRVYDPRVCVETINIVITADIARVLLPDSVLNEMESYNSNIRESLLKIRDIYSTLEKSNPVLINPEKLSECEELIEECFKLDNDLENLSLLLEEKVIIPALRGYFPSSEEVTK